MSAQRSAGGGAAPAPTGADETELTYVELNMKFLTALQANDMQAAWDASERLLSVFPGHPSSLAFRALVQERAAAAGTRGTGAAAVKSMRGGQGATSSGSESDDDEDDEEEEDTNDDDGGEDTETTARVPAVAQHAGKAPSAAAARTSATTAAAAPETRRPPVDHEDDDEGEDPFAGLADAEVARQLEKLGMLTRAAERERLAQAAPK
jgi:hypothetical protein